MISVLWFLNFVIFMFVVWRLKVFSSFKYRYLFFMLFDKFILFGSLLIWGLIICVVGVVLVGLIYCLFWNRSVVFFCVFVMEILKLFFFWMLSGLILRLFRMVLICFLFIGLLVSLLVGCGFLLFGRNWRVLI